MDGQGERGGSGSVSKRKQQQQRRRWQKAAATAAPTHLFVEDAHLLVDNLDDADDGAGLAGAQWRTTDGHAQDGPATATVGSYPDLLSTYGLKRAS